MAATRHETPGTSALRARGDQPTSQAIDERTPRGTDSALVATTVSDTDERPRKRPRQGLDDDDDNETERPGIVAASTDPDALSQCSDAPPQRYAQALAALNASFVASLDEQLRVDPASDLTVLTRAYEADVRELRATFAPAAVVAIALKALEDKEDQEEDQEPKPESIAFVASSDVAEMGERELAEDEVYFGASLDLHAFSSSSRQMGFARQASDSAMEFDDASGFLASETTSGAASIWNNPALQRIRVPAAHVHTDNLLCANAFAENWRGMCVQTPVVVKRLASASQTMGNAVAFAQHICAIAPLRHPNIVTVVGVAWDKALDIQVATVYMARGDLRSLLDHADVAALTWAQAKCQVAIDIVDAFAFLHSQLQCPIPSQTTSRKVLIDHNGTAKLHLVQLSAICGAEESLIPWTAPEVLTGQSRSPQSDVYTFGVLLCELDTTRPPYADAANPDSSKMALQVVAQRVARGELTPSVTDACPPGIAALARQCLLLDGTQRPEAVRVAYALREILKNEL